MRVLVRFWTVLVLALCFQGGIASSAASAIKWQHSFERLSVESPQPAETGVAPSTETPWPSCKSMTALPEMASVTPPLRIEAARAVGRDHRRGLWRTLSIDEPPRTSSISS